MSLVFNMKKVKKKDLRIGKKMGNSAYTTGTTGYKWD